MSIVKTRRMFEKPVSRISKRHAMNYMGHFNRLYLLPVLCFGLCGVLFVSGCAQEDAGRGDMAPVAESGEQVFLENCGACHGPTGRGPELAELKALSPSERRDRIRNHPIAGQIPQRLPANELATVIEFLQSE
jgi:mono/diheme cytochrome c family protein